MVGTVALHPSSYDRPSKTPTARHLTVRTIKALAPRPRTQYVAWDTEIRGFGVRVSPQATRTFILKYRLASGRVRWATIARVDNLTLDQARRHARHLLGLVANGEDPLRRKDAARDAPTVGEVAEIFLTDHVEARRKPTTLRHYRFAVDRQIVPLLGMLPIADIDSADALRLHHRFRLTPYQANRTLATFSKFMNWAEQHGYRLLGSNPCRGIEKYREQSRRRYLTPAELKRLGCALRVAERRNAIAPSAIAAVRLLLLTGARVSEILSLRWREVDLPAGVLQLPDSKTGRKTILLSADAREIFQQWPRFAGSPYVFPGEGRGKNKGRHRISLADPWAWLRRRAKIADVRLHDLRHSFASIAVSNGQTLPIIGALLGHSQPATTARYAHLMENPLRVASDATGATIAAALGRSSRG